MVGLLGLTIFGPLVLQLLAETPASCLLFVGPARMVALRGRGSIWRHGRGRGRDRGWVPGQANLDYFGKIALGKSREIGQSYRDAARASQKPGPWMLIQGF